MFSGIVEKVVEVISIEGSDALKQLSISTGLNLSDSKIGDSFCIDGVCLTATSIEGDKLSFDVAPETLRKSTLGTLQEGSYVNFERSLQLGDRLHGHFVFGHVDGVIELLAMKQDGDSLRFAWSLPDFAKGAIVQKGSICLSGVSLTVGEVSEEAFLTYIVPHTVEVTTFGSVIPGFFVNCEIDMLARYVKGALST